MGMSMNVQSQMSPLQIWKDSHNVISLPESEGGPLHSSWQEYQQALDSGQDHHLASRLALPVSLSDLTMSDTSRPCYSGSSESASLSIFLANRLQQQLESTGSILYSLTWKQRATPAGRPYCQRAASALRVREIGHSLARPWTTPTTRAYKDSGDLSRSFFRRDGKMRNDTVYRQMWLHVFGLDGKPTREQMEKLECYQPDLARQIMGFPPEWDDCAVMAMPSSRKLPQNSSKPSEVRVEINPTEIMQPSVVNDYGGSNTPPEHRDSWRTPPELFAGINAEFRFSGDAAASADNALHHCYLTEKQDALKADWIKHFGGGFVWCNPPYSSITPWVEKANQECINGIGTVMLVPSDTSVGWFNLARQACTEVRFITGGRLSFIRADTGKPVNGNNKGSMLIIWNPYRPAAGHTGYVDRDTLMNTGRSLIGERGEAA